MSKNPFDLAPSPPAPEPATGPSFCWNEKGVYGNGRCEELTAHIHCRNCPVFSAAGLQLLNRESPSDYLQERTQQFAVEKHTRPAAHSSAILFRIQSDWLALPTRCFQEVAERRAIHSLPHRSRSLVLGLANVRGELLICLSVGHFLRLEGLPPRDEIRSTYHRLLVVSWEGNRLAFPVDEVHGPLRFQPQELQSPATKFPRLQPGLARCVLNWEQRAVTILDPKQLFSAISHHLT